MGVALYRKYRSKKLDEIIGQQHITDTLSKAIAAGKISHAYLFTGPRGVGKTSIARILAHEVNGLEYNEGVVNLDIIEIDAASNRRIDEIRDLREKVHIAPTSAKYKVYIIDEVHMLTREAFNALLKTLEEPPAHCIFILATTESHKLPETIISRTQRFSFKPITPEAISSHLRFIAGKEKFEAEDEALLLLAEHAEGSFRDAISMLDQIGSSGQPITRSSVLNLLGTPPAELLENLWEACRGGNSRSVLELCQSLKDQGYEASLIAKDIANLVRSDITKEGSSTEKLNLLRELLDVPVSTDPQQLLEIALLHYVSVAGPVMPAKYAEPVPKTEIQKSGQKLEAETSDPGPVLDPKKTQKDKIAVTKLPEQDDNSNKTAAVIKNIDASNTNQEFSIELWPKVLATVKDKAASLYTALRLAEPRFEDGVLTLAFKFSLHQKKFTQPANQHLLLGTLKSLSRGIEGVEFVVDPKLEPLAAIAEIQPTEPDIARPVDPETDSTLATINNIFGSSEVLES